MPDILQQNSFLPLNYCLFFNFNLYIIFFKSRNQLIKKIERLKNPIEKI